MNEKNMLADRFEANRTHLRTVAYRMLGSPSEADDAVQEAWLRLNRSDAGAVDNLGGWLTTVVARICLDILRARKSRREEPLGPQLPEIPADDDNAAEREAQLADSVGIALLVVLDKLTPPERVAFVLHDMFDLPFDEIAGIVQRTPAATRQLASRARRRVQGGSDILDADQTRQREVVDAFLAAARGGDLQGLIAVLAPDVVFRADSVAVKMGGPAELRGAMAVAETFKGRAEAAKPALADGAMALAVIFGGRLRILLDLTITDGKIAEIAAIADPESLKEFDVQVLDG